MSQPFGAGFLLCQGQFVKIFAKRSLQTQVDGSATVLCGIRGREGRAAKVMQPAVLGGITMVKTLTSARSAANKAPTRTREVKPKGSQVIQRPGAPKTMNTRKK